MNTRYIFTLFIGITGLSFAPIFVRYSDLSPSAIAFWRVAFSALVLGFFFAFSKQQSAANISWKYLFLPGLFFAGDLALWHTSIKLTSVANATLFANLACIFVSIVSWKFFGEKITLKFIIGTIYAIVGVVILLGVNVNTVENLRGDALGLLTALFYAAYILSIKRLRLHFGTLQLMFFSSAACALCLSPSLLSENSIPRDLEQWGVVFSLAIVSHCFGQGLVAYSLAKLAASFSSVSLLLQAVLATIWAWVLLSEPLSTYQIIGAIVVLAGVYLARKGSQ